MERIENIEERLGSIEEKLEKNEEIPDNKIKENGEKVNPFRKVKWKMNKEEVIKTENDLPAYNSEDYLLYRSPLDNNQPIDYLKDNNLLVVQEIRYNFNNKNQLISAEQWFFPPVMNNPNFEHQKLYSKVTDWLEEKYGKGDYKKIWNGEQKEKEDNELLNLIYLGELILKTTWKTEQTKISLKQEKGEHLGRRIIKTTILYKKLFKKM